MTIKRGTIAFLIAAALMILFTAANASATGVYFQQIPPGYEQSCDLCHSQIPALNAFGEEFKANNYAFPVAQDNSAEPAAAGEPPAAPEPAGQSAPAAAAAVTDSAHAAAEQAAAGVSTIVSGEEGQPAAGMAVTPEELVLGAEEIDIQLVLPSGVTRGDKIQLHAEVRVNGNPAPGKEVVFFQETDFFGPGRVELGRAVTDNQGVAAISYWPRALDNDIRLFAGVAGGAETGWVEAEGILSQTVTGPLVQPFEGLFIPFVGPWMLAIVVGIVWASYLYAAFKVLTIARLGRTREQEVLREQKSRRQAYA